MRPPGPQQNTHCPLAPKSLSRPSTPKLYPRHTERGVPLSQLQKHNSFAHDWKWWPGSVMTTTTSLGHSACSPGHYTKCPNPIGLG